MASREAPAGKPRLLCGGGPDSRPHGPRLLAALVGHLRLGGVSIVDSALFQRDISSLLACDIQSVYVQVKHLLKLFPVYFSEIGAEGELRAVSTRIDEALRRRDPLCNFLRKQSHVECNPHLIDSVLLTDMEIASPTAPT